MTFSQDELIALLSNNSYQIGDINSPLPLLYIEDIKPIHGQLNQEVTIDIRGYGFTPDMEITIPGINITEFRVINFFYCKVTIQIDYGQFHVSFYLDSNEVETYSDTVLVINPSFTIDWIDYRITVPSLLRSSKNELVTTSLPQAKVTQTSSGLSSSESNNWIVFPDILLPINSIFVYESICTFSNGSNAIRTGLSSNSLDWINPLRTVLAVNGLENRSYSRVYQGYETFYESMDTIKGANWLDSVIHTVVEFNRGKVHTKVFGRSSLDYDWNNASNGEFIFEQYLTANNLEGTFTPVVWFMAQNNTSCLVAQRVS